MRACAFAEAASRNSDAATAARLTRSRRSIVIPNRTRVRISRETVADSGRQTDATPTAPFMRHSHIEHKAILGDQNAKRFRLIDLRQHGRIHVGQHYAARLE